MTHRDYMIRLVALIMASDMTCTPEDVLAQATAVVDGLIALGHLPQEPTVVDSARTRAMERAIRGGSALRDTPALLEFLADRLTIAHGEDSGASYVRAARERADMLRNSLLATVP